MISNRREKLKSNGDHVSIFSHLERYAMQMTRLTHLATRLLPAEITPGVVVTASLLAAVVMNGFPENNCSRNFVGECLEWINEC